MRTSLIAVSALLLVAFIPSGSIGDGADPRILTSINSFAQACQRGDLQGYIKNVSGPFFERRRVLLTKNKGYSKYLVEYFKKVSLSVVDVETVEGVSANVTIRRHFEDGSSLDSRLVMRRTPNGLWKIYDEILEE